MNIYILLDSYNSDQQLAHTIPISWLKFSHPWTQHKQDQSLAYWFAANAPMHVSHNYRWLSLSQQWEDNTHICSLLVCLTWQRLPSLLAIKETACFKFFLKTTLATHAQWAQTRNITVINIILTAHAAWNLKLLLRDLGRRLLSTCMALTTGDLGWK